MLDKFKCQDTATLRLLDPDGREMYFEDENGQKKYITITLKRGDSAEVQKFRNKILNARLRSVAHTGKMKFRDVELVQDEATDILVFCTVSWENVGLSGVELPCTPENARRLYDDASLSFIRKQVDEFITDDGNFLGNSSRA